jgi:hypothetical protein
MNGVTLNEQDDSGVELIALGNVIGQPFVQVVIGGSATDSYLGKGDGSIENLGDVNGDGLDDLGIKDTLGQFFIIWGQSFWPVNFDFNSDFTNESYFLDLSLASSLDGVFASSSLIGEAFNFKGVGDVDGDGYDDADVRLETSDNYLEESKESQVSSRAPPEPAPIVPILPAEKLGHMTLQKQEQKSLLNLSFTNHEENLDIPASAPVSSRTPLVGGREATPARPFSRSSKPRTPRSEKGRAGVASRPPTSGVLLDTGAEAGISKFSSWFVKERFNNDFCSCFCKVMCPSFSAGRMGTIGAGSGGALLDT